MPAGNLVPPCPPPQYSKPWPPNILNLPTPMNIHVSQPNKQVNKTSLLHSRVYTSIKELQLLDGMFHFINSFKLSHFHFSFSSLKGVKETMYFRSKFSPFRVDYFLEEICHPGPGCSKLTTSLVNETLKFQTLISQVCQYCGAKASHIFSTKNISVFGYKVIKHLTS